VILTSGNSQRTGRDTKMSVIYCHYCDKHIDLDYNAEHFTPESALEVCVQEAEDKELCMNCGSDDTLTHIDVDRDEIYMECRGCGSN